MRKVSLSEAKDQLDDLVEDALHGEDIVIERDGRAVARLVSVRPIHRPCFGSAAGKFTVAEDFDAPLTDLDEYTR